MFVCCLLVTVWVWIGLGYVVGFMLICCGVRLVVVRCGGLIVRCGVLGVTCWLCFFIAVNAVNC